MKKVLLSFVAVAAIVLSFANNGVAGCDGMHLYACRSDLATIQSNVNANCEAGATVYVHIVC